MWSAADLGRKLKFQLLFCVVILRSGSDEEPALSLPKGPRVIYRVVESRPPSADYNIS